VQDDAEQGETPDPSFQAEGHQIDDTRFEDLRISGF
jgi:hypothetical protein